MGCRTRVIGNHYDPTREIVNGRGNLSFTSVNLAMSIAAEMDHTVMLVDADVARPSILRMLGLPVEPLVTPLTGIGVMAALLALPVGVGVWLGPRLGLSAPLLTTWVAGLAPRMPRVASMPSPPGMTMSTNATSGFSRPASSA